MKIIKKLLKCIRKIIFSRDVKKTRQEITDYLRKNSTDKNYKICLFHDGSCSLGNIHLPQHRKFLDYNKQLLEAALHPLIQSKKVHVIKTKSCLWQLVVL